MEKALVVFSGGQDSTTCLLWALEEFDEVETVTFWYGQRNEQEIECAENIAKELGVNHKIIKIDTLQALTSNAMTRKDISIKEEGDLPNTFVEGRNHIFLSYAAIYAKTRQIQNIIIGVSETESSGYPDCSNAFIQSLNHTLNVAMDEQFQLITPLMWKDKKEVWKMADEMGRLQFIKDKTLTCYEGVMGTGCGTCPACKLRNNAYENFEQEKHAI